MNGYTSPASTSAQNFRLTSELSPACRWLGAVIPTEPVGKDSPDMVAIHRCHLRDQPCVRQTVPSVQLTAKHVPDPIVCCETCSWKCLTPRYVGMTQLFRDTLKLASGLPPDVVRVAGVARSGLPVATTLSLLWHIPLIVIRQTNHDFVEVGRGGRLTRGTPSPNGVTLVVDDAVATGNTLRRVLRMMEAAFDNVQSAALYVNPLASRKPDYWVADLPWPHILEWRLFNSALTRSCVIDFDGVLCHRFPQSHVFTDRDFAEFLSTTSPRFPVRREPIPILVTTRPESDRRVITAWLDRWGIAVERLLMSPIASPRHQEIIAWKSELFRQFRHKPVKPGPHLFLESDPVQARKIAESTGGLVVCPILECCFSEP